MRFDASLDATVDALGRHDVDVMMLGREANARIVAATTRLWLAGTRPFTPSCVVVRATRGVHVLANSNDAVPAGFPVAHLFGLTWNTDRLLAALRAIPGLSAARRVAVDGMTPLMRSLLRDAMPDAELVDAAPIIAELWALPDPERVDAVRAAAEVASAGLAAMRVALRPGVRPRALRGLCAHAFSSFGVTTPAFEAVVSPLNASASTWLSPERVIADDELVVLRAGALRDGWEASVARTYVVAEPPTEQPPPPRWEAVVDRCRAGATAGTLRQLGAVVYGVGHGVEPWDDDYVLTDGTTCAVEVAHASSLRQDVFVVTDAGTVPLT